MSARDVTQLIGNTPLLHLREASERTGCTILGKAEFLNPGSSVKDRTALGIIEDARERGGGDLPRPVQSLMRAAAWVMTTVAHRI